MGLLLAGKVTSPRALRNLGFFSTIGRMSRCRYATKFAPVRSITVNSLCYCNRKSVLPTARTTTVRMACRQIVHSAEVFVIDDGNGLCVVVDARRRRRNCLLDRLNPLVNGAANVVNAHLSVDAWIPAVLNLNLTTIVVAKNPPLAAVMRLKNCTRYHVGEENFVTFNRRQRVRHHQV